MREFQASVSDCLNRILCLFFTITLLSSPSAPRFLLPFSGSFILFLPPPVPIPYRLPYFTRRRRFSFSLHPLLSPISPGRRATVQLDSTPACRPPPLVYNFLPYWSIQGVTHAILCLPSLVWLPPLFCPRPSKSGPCPTQGSTVQGYPLYSACLHHPQPPPPPPPAGLNQRPIRS